MTEIARGAALSLFRLVHKVRPGPERRRVARSLARRLRVQIQLAEGCYTAPRTIRRHQSFLMFSGKAFETREQEVLATWCETGALGCRTPG
jgi:hypothetical protein